MTHPGMVPSHYASTYLRCIQWMLFILNRHIHTQKTPFGKYQIKKILYKKDIWYNITFIFIYNISFYFFNFFIQKDILYKILLLRDRNPGIQKSYVQLYW